MMIVVASLTLLLAIGSPPPAGLSPVERQIVAEIDAANPDALALLERSVNVNSGTMNFKGVRKVGRLFARELDALGFTTHWVDGAAFDRAGHLTAERPGRGPTVLLVGHLDTVFEPDSPSQRYERRSETEAAGPGAIDMKGGNVIMIHALRALAGVGALDDLHVRVVLTGDEERPGRPFSLSRMALREAAEGADYAIGFEDGDGDPRTAVIARRGSTSWTLRATGTPAHSSQVFSEAIGAGAIYEAARILTTFYERLSTEPDVTFNPGVIVGGTDVALDSPHARGTAFGKNNVVAGHAMVDGDLRAISPEQYERAMATMREIVAENLPRTSATLTFSDGYPPLAPTDGSRALLARYSRVSEDLGLGPVAPVDPRNAGAADVSLVADLVPQVLDGIGLMGRGGHTVNEIADLTTLASQTRRAAVLLCRLAREGRYPAD